MKSVVITSSGLRHSSFLDMVCKNCDVTLAVIEKKINPKDGFIFLHEQDYFKEYVNYKPIIPYIECEKDMVNETRIENIIKNENPDTMFIFGCSILKSNIFSIPHKGCINIHTGIVQVFRGVDSSFWSIYNEKPEGIGATVHYVDNSIDAGEIIGQRTPELSVDDDFSDLFLKSCKCGFDLLKDNLNDIREDKVKSFILKNRGKLYCSKDFSKEIFQEANGKLKRVLTSHIKKEVK